MYFGVFPVLGSAEALFYFVCLCALSCLILSVGNVVSAIFVFLLCYLFPSRFLLDCKRFSEVVHVWMKVGYLVWMCEEVNSILTE